MSQSNLIQLIRDQNEEISQLQRDLLYAEEKVKKIEKDHKTILLRTKCHQFKKGYRTAETELTSALHAELYKCIKNIEEHSGQDLLTQLYLDNIELNNLLTTFIEES